MSDFDYSGFGSDFGTAGSAGWDGGSSFWDTPSTSSNPEYDIFGGSRGSSDYVPNSEYQPEFDSGGETSISRWLSEFVQTPGGQRIAGGVITGVAGGILQALNGNKQAKARKDELRYSYDLQNQQRSQEVARASAMPKLNRMTNPQQRAAASIPTGWQAPSITAASQRQQGLLSQRRR